MPEIKLVAGLGNPGRDYAHTRHNAGFMAVEAMAGPDGAWKRWEGMDLARSGDLYLVKPQDFMNRSGLAVRRIADYYHIQPKEMLVLFDDFALPLGTLRLRRSGSAGGHNGMSSIIEAMGTQEIPRLRLGIGPVPSYLDPADFVLGKFSADERTPLAVMIDAAAETARRIVTDGIEAAASRMGMPK